MEILDLLSFENMRGECSFEFTGEFLKEMNYGDIYIIHCRPNSDRDIQIYKFNNQPERLNPKDAKNSVCDSLNSTNK